MNDAANANGRGRALLALALLLPMPALGTYALLFAYPGAMGKCLAFAAKGWILLLPLIWHVVVQRRAVKLQRPTMRGMGAAVITGLLILAVIWCVFKLVEPSIAIGPVREKAAATGFDDPAKFAAMFVWIILVNSLAEEYIWRWFVFRQFERLMPGPAAVIAAALAFTVHHAVALAAWVAPWINVLGCAGVFVGGATWSWLYLRYRSVWPCYVSHIFADVAILLAAIVLIFK